MYVLAILGSDKTIISEVLSVPFDSPRNMGSSFDILILLLQ